MIFIGARRDEEKLRAKERVFSLRDANHRWDPRAQRPEMWNLYNTRLRAGESLRVSPLANWTEADIWRYIAAERIPIVPLYFAAERPVVECDGQWIVVDDDRLPLLPGENPQLRRVRFRTLGCYPLTAAIRERRGHARQGHRRDPRDRPLGARGAPYRPRRRSLDGAQEAGGLLLKFS